MILIRMIFLFELEMTTIFKWYLKTFYSYFIDKKEGIRISFHKEWLQEHRNPQKNDKAASRERAKGAAVNIDTKRKHPAEGHQEA